MRGSTHATVGANAVWIPALLGLTVQPWLVFLGAFVALLPDLDASESLVKNLAVSARVGGARVRIRPFYPMAVAMSTIFRHRGPLHSLVALVLVAAAAGFLAPYIGLAGWLVVGFGYFSHLLADGVTKSGLELLWPHRAQVRFLPHALTVKTGGIIDTVLLLLSSGGVILFLYRMVEF